MDIKIIRQKQKKADVQDGREKALNGYNPAHTANIKTIRQEQKKADVLQINCECKLQNCNSNHVNKVDSHQRATKRCHLQIAGCNYCN